MERCDYLPSARRRYIKQHLWKALHCHWIEAGFECETPIKNTGAGAAMMRIEAARRVFPRCSFNERNLNPQACRSMWE
jgi:hypothetical protein